MAEAIEARPTVPRWAAFLLIAGLYLTLRGYHSFDGDQAYRLPILLHQQDPALFAGDPFVRAFDAFNPHRGYLWLLDVTSRPFGLAAALLGLFGLTMAATMVGVDRLARAVWPGSGVKVGLVAVVLVLAAKAGNVGTNHLFEGTLLDRLVGFALGWLAIASAVGDPGRGIYRAAAWLGMATLVHPSVGLQLAMTLGVGWLGWCWLGRSMLDLDPAYETLDCTGRARVLPSRRDGPLPGQARSPRLGGSLALPNQHGRARTALTGVAVLGLAVAPGMAMMVGQGGSLFEGLPTDEFRRLAVYVQGPQHMLPSTWRASQWLAWACYPCLGVLALFGARGDWSAARVRLAALMAVNLVSLATAYVAVEVVGDLRVTLFQPFRMATLARGLAMVAVSGRLVELWDRGDLASRGRATLIAVGLGGDWAMVVATAVDVGMAVAGRSRRVSLAIGGLILAGGLVFLARHDTERGHLPILAGLGLLIVGSLVARARPMAWTRRRLAFALAGAWAVPALAMGVGLAMAEPDRHGWSAALVARCRFAEVPTDDLERLGIWAREHVEASSRFVGPPGPKTFRLWSRRSVAFNRSGSPYNAAGLADWSGRYRDHVGFSGTTREFVAAYLADRHGLEAGFERMTDGEKAAMARRQGATHVMAFAPAGGSKDGGGPLELLKVEGRYAVYRVR